MNHNGAVRFYTYTADCMWFEYEVKFTDGKLTSIEPISIHRDEAGRTRHVLYPTPGQ